MRILVVEDEPKLAAQLVEGLTEAGYAVDRADNGRDAHFIGDVEPLDAVVLDLGLPLMDGITVLKKWRSAGRTMPNQPAVSMPGRPASAAVGTSGSSGER